MQGAKNPYSTEGKGNDELLEGANKIQVLMFYHLVAAFSCFQPLSFYCMSPLCPWPKDLTFDSLARSRIMIEQSKDLG